MQGSPEVAPWSKVGGLGDVLQALPQALAARGHQVMTVAPRYATYEDAAATGVLVPLDLPWDLVGQPEEQVQPHPRPTAAAETRDAGLPQQALRAGHAHSSSGEAGAVGWEVRAASPSQPGGEGVGSPTGGAGRQAAVGAVEAAGGPGPAQDSSGSILSGATTGPAREAQAAAGAGVGTSRLTEEPLRGVQPHAEYHLCRQGGVDRVFVDHPLFLGAGIYGGGPAGSGSASSGVYTYTHIASAAGHHPTVELQYNVLCQAALAAPMLLWGCSSTGGSSGKGAAGSSGPAADSGGGDAGSEGVGRPHWRGRAEGTVAPGGEECTGSQGLEPAGSDESVGRAGGEEPPVVFCANDWPTALLPLRLHHCIRSLQGTLTREPWHGGLGASPVAGGDPQLHPRAQLPQQQPGPPGAAGNHAPVLAMAAEAPPVVGAGAGRLEAQRAQQAVGELYRQLAQYLRTATSAYCIHNLAYQGLLPAASLPYLGLPPSAVTELCRGGDWRSRLVSLQAQRDQWQRQGSSHVLATGQGPGQQQQQSGVEQARGPAIAGPEVGRLQAPGAAGGDGEEARGGRRGRKQQQRRWRWKRKLREAAAAAAQAGHQQWQGESPLAPDQRHQQQTRERRQQRGEQGQHQCREEQGQLVEPGPRAEPGASPSCPTPASVMGSRAASLAELSAAAAAACPSGQLNLKQGALLASDALVTVSPGYAAEVCQEAGMGCGLRDVIAARGITGIMNGIDIVEWDPATDPRLPEEARYDASTVAAGKARAKALLQRRLGLDVDPSAPLVGFVGRLTEQKGVDVLLGAAPALLAAPAAPAPARYAPQLATRRPQGEGACGGVDAGMEAASGCHAVSLASGAEGAEQVAAGPALGWAEGPGGPGEFAPPASSTSGSSGHGRGWLEGRGRRRTGGRQASPAPPQCLLAHPGPRGRQGTGSSSSSSNAAVRAAPLLANLAQPASLSVPEEGACSPGCSGCEEECAEIPVQHAEQAQQEGACEPAKAGDSPGGGRLQLVVLGTGEPWLEAALGGLEKSYQGQAAGVTQFSEELAHWIMAGADFLLVPSRFEPCGLVAQCGVRYGAVPIVTAVGGLKDLVTPEVGHTITPFGFDKVASTRRQNVQELVAAVQSAVREYGSEAYRRRQAACMALDVSWDRPAAEWEAFLWGLAAHVHASSAAGGGPAGQES
ncbi:hypothetical protein N2152v2_002012 [Parachlorella kessleri]